MAIGRFAADGEDGVALHEHRAHGHFAGGFGAARRLEREAHEVDVAAKCHADRKLPRMGTALPDCAGRIGDFGRQCRCLALATVRAWQPASASPAGDTSPWRKVFYPDDLAQHRELEFASRAFPSIEINGSFYSLQSPASWAAWYAATPADFVFSVKGPRYITHILRLKGIVKPMANFFASGVFNLREKLGPILWQFPPHFHYNASRFEEFFQLLPRDTEQALKLARRRDARMHGRSVLRIDANRPLRHAVEIRHQSFVECGIHRAVAPPWDRPGGGRYGRQMAVPRGRHGRFPVPAPARRQGAVRQRLHRVGARRVG